MLIPVTSQKNHVSEHNAIPSSVFTKVKEQLDKTWSRIVKFGGNENAIFSKFGA